MKRSYTLFLLVLLCYRVSAQDAQKEINEQVWKPFIESFNNFDTERFMQVHSKDVVRSSRDDNSILNWTEYHDISARSAARSKERKSSRVLELRFSQRIANNGLAMEVGIYKSTSMIQNEPRTFYGRFHVVLRKESGVWKILVDTDSSEGGTIGEKEFLAAQPL